MICTPKKNNSTMKQAEHNLQKACVQWFRFNYPSMKYLLFAIPNGGLRNIRVATKLKAEGVVAGVPDLFLAIPNQEANGLFIEMKAGKNQLTEAQKYMIGELQGQGYQCKVCRDFDHFMQIIKNYMEITWA
jgi:hypothetical protein